MARKKSAPSNEAPAPKKGGGMMMILGGGCAALLLCLICSGGAGVWFWKKSAIATTPIGKVSVDELDAETNFLEFSFRLPKGMKVLMENQKGVGEDSSSIYYEWAV